MHSNRSRVVVELHAPDAPSARAVLSAALQVLGPQDPVDLVLVLPDVAVPVEADGARVQQLVAALAPDLAALPEILLEGPAEAAAQDALLTVQATGDPVADARATVLLAAVGTQLWEPATPPVAPDAELRRELERATAERDRARAQTRTAVRDLRRAARPAGPVSVVLLFQHRSYWGAVATLHQALAAREDAVVEVVALDSTADGREASTAAFLRAQGITPRSPAWLTAHLDDVDVVLLTDPYDETRPAGLRVQDLTAAGVRLAAVPYGGNAIAGPFMDTLLWDLPLQRLAWRAYLGSATQASLFARHCRAGGEPVRVLGTPKTDRLLRGEPLSARARALREHAAGRPLVLWNPHFRLGPGGWSTFDQYLQPLLELAAADPSFVLLLRPHFRLFRDLRALGAGQVEETVRAAVAATENVVLDEAPDYLDALTACDAMLSDLSSLASELLPTGKPILYLHREDGPGPNEEGAHFAAMYRAEDVADVRAFLELVRTGQDPRRAERLAVVARDLPHADGAAAQRIAEDLVTGLRTELGAGLLGVGA